MLCSFSTIRRFGVDDSLIPFVYFRPTFKHIFVLFFILLDSHLLYIYVYLKNLIGI